MKKFLLLLVLFSIAISTQARKVAFRVDMTGQTVGVNGVHMVGNFKDINYDGNFENAGLVNWDPTVYGLAGPNNGIYSIVMDLTPGLPYEFKFINGNDWPQAENVPNQSKVSTSNGNRWVYIPASLATDTLQLDAIMFGGNAPAGMKLIRFAVDMKNVVNISSDGVHVAGAFQGWDPAKTQMANYKGDGLMSGMLYEYLGYVTAGTGTEFKYVNGNAWGGAESVPSACATGGNRSVVTVTTDSLLSKVCFGSCDACPGAPIPKFNATFRIDMSTVCSFDSVDIAGGVINGWAGGTKLNPISVGSKTYSVTVALDSGEIEYKFRKIFGGNVSWEGLANRKFQLTKDTVLGIVCFDSELACVPVPAPANVHFVVDLSNEIPDPNGDIFVTGNFTEPNWQGGAIKMTPVVGQIGIYESTFMMCPGTFFFKFYNGPVSSDANAETFPDTAQRACVVPSGVGGFNRTYTRIDANTKEVGFVFNTCNALVGVDAQLKAEKIKLYPNPTESNATIVFNDQLSKHNLVVTDVTGRIIDQYSNITEKQIIINSNKYTTGLYFVQISNELNETATVKLVVR